MKYKSVLVLVLTLTIIAAGITSATAATYHVDGEFGDDTNAGASWATAYKTITKATSGLSDGDVIHVRNGHREYRFQEHHINIMKDHITLKTEDASEIDKLFQTTGNNMGISLTNTPKGITIDGFVVYNAEWGVYVSTNAEAITIKNCVVSGCNPQTGIHVSSGGRGIVIENCTLTSNDHGIVFYEDVKDSTIQGNTITANDKNGISLQADSDGNTISNNLIEGNGFGVRIADSHYTTITGNEVNSNQYNGIYWLGTASHNTVTNNQIRGNEYGIIPDNEGNKITGNTIAGSGLGIKFGGGSCCPDTEVRGNTIEGCSYGIFTQNSAKGVVVTGNYIRNNQHGYHITNGGVNGHEVYFNDFVGNADYNAWDQAPKTHNLYAVDGRGNYWDDYGGVDADLNMIGDTPYWLHYGHPSTDDCPLMCSIAIWPDCPYENGVNDYGSAWRIFWYVPFFEVEQAGAFPFTKAADGTVIKSCTVPEGECVRDSHIANGIYVIYTEGRDSLWLGIRNLGITIQNTDGSSGTAKMWLFIINLAAYIPLPESMYADWTADSDSLWNLLFKFTPQDSLIGIRAWWVVIAGLMTVVWLVTGRKKVYIQHSPKKKR